MNSSKHYNLGIVGVRGYVGKELLALIDSHPNITTQWVSSRQLEGQPLEALFEESEQKELTHRSIKIESLTPEEIAKRNTDIIVLALPNGLAAPFVENIERYHATQDFKDRVQIIIDLSTDYRFMPDDEQSPWIYSVPELDYKQLISAREHHSLIKISNPGCYATAMQLGLAPIINQLTEPAHCFGVSGYSGAGTKPSPNNDPNNLKDNLIGYALANHLHEKEVSHRFGRQVYFSPHVASFFRGINMTVHVHLIQPQTKDGLLELFKIFYADMSLIKIQEQIPVVKQVVGQPDCIIGGFSIGENKHHVSFVSCIDNLTKGAASQAIQNIELALGLEQSNIVIKGECP